MTYRGVLARLTPQATLAFTNSAAFRKGRARQNSRNQILAAVDLAGRPVVAALQLVRQVGMKSSAEEEDSSCRQRVPLLELPRACLLTTRYQVSGCEQAGES